MSNETGHHWEPEEDHGLGVGGSAGMEGGPDPTGSGVQWAGLAAAVVISADDGKFLGVVNEADV